MCPEVTLVFVLTDELEICAEVCARLDLNDDLLRDDSYEAELQLEGPDDCELLVETLRKLIADDVRFLSAVVVDFSEETGIVLVINVVFSDLVLTTGVSEVSNAVDKENDDVLLTVIEKEEV